MTSEKEVTKEELSRISPLINVLKNVTVEPFSFLVMFAFTCRLVSFQSLLMDRACRNLMDYSKYICDDLDSHIEEQSISIEAGNNLYTGVMLMASLPAVVVAIFVGPWSDKYSRKYPLIIAGIGMVLESTATAVITSIPSSSPVWFVCVSLIAGVTGGFIMNVSASYSYVSDITDERSRPTRYAILEFSNICAVVLGNVLGAQIFDHFGYTAVMTVTPCSLGIGVIYVMFLVKETKPKVPNLTPRQMFADMLTLDNLKESYKTCRKRRPGNIRLQIWLLVFISCSQKFTDMGTLAVAYPFARKMYHWSVSAFSNASTAFYIVNAIVTIAAVPILSIKLKLHEAALGLVGMLSLISKMVLTSVAIKEPLFYYAWMSGTLNNCAGIAIRARLSKLVHKDELGRAFSLLGTCESVTPLLGTVAFVQMYNASLLIFPGLPFAVSAVLLLPCAFAFAWMMKLPTVTMGDYDREDKDSQSLQTISSNYATLKEEA